MGALQSGLGERGGGSHICCNRNIGWRYRMAASRSASDQTHAFPGVVGVAMLLFSSALLSLSGFAALCAATRKQAKVIGLAPLSRGYRIGLRMAGFTGLGLGLIPCVCRSGTAIGIVIWLLEASRQRRDADPGAAPTAQGAGQESSRSGTSSCGDSSRTPPRFVHPPRRCRSHPSHRLLSLRQLRPRAEPWRAFSIRVCP